MIFTTGILMAICGFFIGHLLGDSRRSVYNKFDYVACTLFVFGVLGMLSSIFTITWRYMP